MVVFVKTGNGFTKSGCTSSFGPYNRETYSDKLICKLCSLNASDSVLISTLEKDGIIAINVKPLSVMSL